MTAQWLRVQLWLLVLLLCGFGLVMIASTTAGMNGKSGIALNYGFLVKQSLALAIGLVIAIWQGAMSVYWWRQWRLWRADDPSAAELYELNFRVEAALSLIGLAIAIVGIWLIRRIGRRRG